MSTTSMGKAAEQAVAEKLKDQGLCILAMNWRTKQCEIDIVASEKSKVFKKQKLIRFVEVKYRKSVSQGTGFDYITTKKLKQMQYAAQIWSHENNWQGDYQLDVAAVTGNDKSWEIELIANITG